MTAQAKRILAQAVALPPSQRAALVEELLSTFEFPSRVELDALWAAEAEDRLRAHAAGSLLARPARSVFARINRRRGK